jgi:hypothetical protein
VTSDGKEVPDLTPDAARNRASWDEAVAQGVEFGNLLFQSLRFYLREGTESGPPAKLRRTPSAGPKNRSMFSSTEA